MDTPDGHRAIKAVRENYEESIRLSEMTQGESGISGAVAPLRALLRIFWSRSRVSPPKSAENLTLVSGALDTKIMARYQDVKHALRPKNPAAKRSTLDLLPLVYPALTRPDAVFQDKQDVGTFHFVSALIGDGVLDVVVRRCLDITSLRVRTIKVGTWSDMVSVGELVK